MAHVVLVITVAVVQLFVRLVVAPDRVQDTLDAFNVVMRPALRARGCRLTLLCQCPRNERLITYIEEWEDSGSLKEQFGSRRFARLCELLETAAERPVVEFRVIDEVHGLEYVTSNSLPEPS